MIVVLIGDDNFSKENFIEKFLIDTLGERKDDPLAKQIIFATDTNIPSIAEAVMTACDSVSMFAPEQTVVVRKAEALKADESKSLAQWISHSPSCQLLLEFEKLDARGELYKTLKKVADIQKFDVPKQYEMGRWISQMVREHFKKAIDENACVYLSDALGTDTKLVCEEIEKIILYKPQAERITLDMVQTMVVSQRELRAYEINTSFGLRNSKEYVRHLNDLLNKGIAGPQIVSSLYNYALDLLNFSKLVAQGKAPNEAASALGKNPYAFVKIGRAPEAIRQWSPALLVRVLRRLIDLDYEMKSGLCSTRISQELALASLVVR